MNHYYSVSFIGGIKSFIDIKEAYTFFDEMHKENNSSCRISLCDIDTHNTLAVFQISKFQYRPEDNYHMLSLKDINNLIIYKEYGFKFYWHGLFMNWCTYLTENF